MRERRAINKSRVENDIIRRLEDLERESYMLWDIVATVDNIAVCDNCQNVWFFTKHPQEGGLLGVCGDANGLLAHGGAWCGKCLDTLYALTTSMDQEELDDTQNEVARWLIGIGRGWLNQTAFGKDPDVLAIMRRNTP